jgi:hypothetical protein
MDPDPDPIKSKFLELNPIKAKYLDPNPVWVWKDPQLPNQVTMLTIMNL